MLRYAIRRILDAAHDPEDYGSGREGIAARTCMVVTGPIHLPIVFTGSGGRAIVGCQGREHLLDNHFTRNRDPALRGGVIGCLLVSTAMIHSGSQAGGNDKALAWLSGQPYGRVPVGLLCAGSLGFALFCAVNAGDRLIPKARGGDIETSASRLKRKAS